MPGENLQNCIRTYCHANPLKWCDYIAPITEAINSTPNKSSTLSPFFIKFGIERPTAFDCIIMPTQQFPDSQQYLRTVRENQQLASRIADARIKASQQTQKITMTNITGHRT